MLGDGLAPPPWLQETAQKCKNKNAEDRQFSKTICSQSYLHNGPTFKTKSTTQDLQMWKKSTKQSRHLEENKNPLIKDQQWVTTNIFSPTVY